MKGKAVNQQICCHLCKLLANGVWNLANLTEPIVVVTIFFVFFVNLFRVLFGEPGRVVAMSCDITAFFNLLACARRSPESC